MNEGNIEKMFDLEDDEPIPEAPYADLDKVGFWDRKSAKLIIIWNEKISRNRQILILRKVYPKLKALSTAAIYNIVQKNQQQWQFAEMGWGLAVDLAEEARAFGLDIIVEEVKKD